MRLVLLEKARKLHRRRMVLGLPVSVETQAGALRHWKNGHDGTAGSTRALHDYGYLRGTVGLDGEQLDVYVGPHRDATHAHVVTQMRAPEFREVDEHKVMLGFRDPDEAKAAYLRHYNSPKFFGSIESIPIEEFRRRARAEKPFGKAENVAPDVFPAAPRLLLAREHVAPRDKRKPPPFVSPDGRQFADPDFTAPWTTAEQRDLALHRSPLGALWSARLRIGHGGFATVFDAGPGAVVKVTQSKTDSRALAAIHASEKIPRGVPLVYGYRELPVDPSSAPDGSVPVPCGAAWVERVLDHRHVERADYLALWLAMDHFGDKAPPDASGMLAHLDLEADRDCAREAAVRAVRYCDELREGWDWLRRNAMLPEADVHIENVGIARRADCAHAVWLDMGSGQYDDFAKSGGPFIGPRGGKWADAARTKSAGGRPLPEFFVPRDAEPPAQIGRHPEADQGELDDVHAPSIAATAQTRKAFPRLSLLLKAAPAGGWQLIPRGRHGGYRRRAGGGWEYWYPGAHGGKPGVSPQEPGGASAGWGEAEFAAGRYDRDPEKWEFVRRGSDVVGWTAGGVDPGSAHPVKVAGSPHKLYRIARPEAEVGWAALVNVNDPADEVVVSHERVAPVEYRRAAAARAPEAAPAPEGAGEQQPPRSQTGWVAGSSQRLPAFAQSTARDGTALRRLESGEYPSKLRRQFAEDADGVPRLREDRVVAMPDGDKMRLLEEFAPMVRSVAKKAMARFALARDAETRADMQSAAMEGLLHAIEEYRGGSSFALSAAFMANQHARLHAVREFRGGLHLPRRHGQLLAGFLAARAEAFRIYGHDPSAKEVASTWRLRKRDVHEGLRTGREDIIPMGRYSLRAGDVAEGDERPGKIEWAERYLEFLEGQRSHAGEEFFGSEQLFGSGVGAGLGAEERVVNSHALHEALDRLRHFEASFGGQHYRVDAGELLKRHLGFGGEPESVKETTRHVAIERRVGEEYRAMSPRGAEAVVPELVERAVAEARRHLEGEGAGLLERAATQVREPLPVAAGPSAFQLLEARARSVTAAEVREWRGRERARLRALEQRHRRGGDAERADSARRALARLDRLGRRRARRMVAEERLMSEPRNREWFRSAIPLPIEVERRGEEYGHRTMTLTDPATGHQRRVRVRTVRELDDVYKSEAAGPDAAAVRFAASFPRLGALLFGSQDALAAGLMRHDVLELAGLLGADE